jgi:hypothetical protein
MNVAGEIIEDRTGALDGRFTVNDPVFLPYGFGQMNIFEWSANTSEEDAAKQLVLSGRHPRAPIRRQTAAGHQTVYMGMVCKI